MIFMLLICNKWLTLKSFVAFLLDQSLMLEEIGAPEGSWHHLEGSCHFSSSKFVATSRCCCRHCCQLCFHFRPDLFKRIFSTWTIFSVKYLCSEKIELDISMYRILIRESRCLSKWAWLTSRWWTCSLGRGKRWLSRCKWFWIWI